MNTISSLKISGIIKRAASAVYSILLISTLFLSPAAAAAIPLDKSTDGYKTVESDFIEKYIGTAHSMDSPEKYAASKTLVEIVDGVKSGFYKRIIVVEGGRDSALKWLETAGAGHIKRLEGKNSKNEKWDYFEAAIGGETVAVEFHAFGEDMLRHLMMCQAFAGVSRDKISGVLRNRWFELCRADYDSFLKTIGRIDIGIIGYRRSIVRHIYWRLTAVRKAETIVKTISSHNGAANLIEEIKRRILHTEGFHELRAFKKEIDIFSKFILEFEPLQKNGAGIDRFFTSSDEYYALDKADRALKNILCELKKNGAANSRLFDLADEKGIKFKAIEGKAGEYFEQSFDIRRITFKTRNGEMIVAAACEHPYGSAASAMAQAMCGAGAKKIFFYGSCGAIFENARHYEIIVPRSFVTERGYIENPFVKKIENNKTIKISKLHASVFSPLCESAPAIADLKKLGVGSVDVESAHVMRDTAGSGVTVNSLFIVSDIPGTRNTLDGWDRENDDYVRSQMKALDLIIGDIEAVGVELK